MRTQIARFDAVYLCFDIDAQRFCFSQTVEGRPWLCAAFPGHFFPPYGEKKGQGKGLPTYRFAPSLLPRHPKN